MGQLGHLVRREQFLGQNYFEGLAYLPVRQNKNVTFLFSAVLARRRGRWWHTHIWWLRYVASDSAARCRRCHSGCLCPWWQRQHVLLSPPLPTPSPSDDDDICDVGRCEAGDSGDNVVVIVAPDEGNKEVRRTAADMTTATTTTTTTTATTTTATTTMATTKTSTTISNSTTW